MQDLQTQAEGLIHKTHLSMPEEQSFNLLIVEDDPSIAEMLRTFFTSHGVTTTIAPDGKQALKLVASFNPDIIVLDIVLPYLDGLSVLNRLRTDSINTPVILLTEKNSVEEKLQGFEHGADDYVTKPFSPRELLVRVHAVLRRSRSISLNNRQQILSIGGLTINPLTREVRLPENTFIPLTKTEFDLLYFLAGRKDQAVPHAVILEKVLGYNPTSQTKALVMHIANIRKKFEFQEVKSIKLQPVPGIGYKLVEMSINPEK
ncbi:MAG: response regulator [Desulfobulbaceae bacterium]|nr:response regulator [Desulfobulbaceae bacterium]